MQRPILNPIRQITIISLRDYILDNNLTEYDTLNLNKFNFDNIAIEYLDTYKETIPMPYFLLTVLIQANNTMVPLNSLGVIKNDNNRFANDYAKKKESQPDDSYAYETIFRCGWCGNVVDFDGNEFDILTRAFKIRILEKFKSTVIVENVYGECCSDKHRN